MCKENYTITYDTKYAMHATQCQSMVDKETRITTVRNISSKKFQNSKYFFLKTKAIFCSLTFVSRTTLLSVTEHATLQSKL